MNKNSPSKVSNLSPIANTNLHTLFSPPEVSKSYWHYRYFATKQRSCPQIRS